MVIKIFKISTKEMYTIPNKEALCNFISKETGTIMDNKMTIFKLMTYLPRENYCRVK